MPEGWLRPISVRSFVKSWIINGTFHQWLYIRSKSSPRAHKKFGKYTSHKKWHFMNPMLIVISQNIKSRVKSDTSRMNYQVRKIKRGLSKVTNQQWQINILISRVACQVWQIESEMETGLHKITNPCEWNINFPQK